ncbi:MAG TPA: cation-translocating P-type ATPase [Parasegetibacter sp.]
MEKVNWKVKGMTCANCALAISRYLQSEGLEDVKVNPISGAVSFVNTLGKDPQTLISGIDKLGYKVASTENGEGGKEKFLSTYLQKFLFCLIFTLPLMAHMIWHVHWLMNPWVQMVLCLPVFVVGMMHFGKSAWKSIRNGIPNMNVLVTLGAIAAFVYSLAGALMGLGENYLFFETAATIITLVLLGNYLEERSIASTQKALNKLVKSQKIMANMIVFDDQHKEVILPIENSQLRVGDLVLIKTGDQVPADCKILWGEASADESIITGESLPVEKVPKDVLIGGSILVKGTVKAQVTANAGDSVLSNIINLVKQAQGDKPPVQQLADRISAIFIPVVIGIGLITLIVNYFVLHDFSNSLMRAIAVLVIACPCAMGLATPAAIAVGLGRAARNGILFRDAKSLEVFRNVQQVVFDKTGTLTTGKFEVSSIQALSSDYNEDELKRILYSVEKYSDHPIARSISAILKRKDEIRWKKIEEVKGLGMQAFDKEGNRYIIGSFKAANHLTDDHSHSIYILRNDVLIGYADVKDELRPESREVIRYLHKKGIRTILLSGDRREKTELIARDLGIDQVFAEKSPQEKLDIIEALSNEAPTAMVGDGINDAPALAKATVGISMSEASQIAMQTSDVVLMDHGLKQLPLALGLGKHTFLTIKQNLFWAFFYNVLAIPVAAVGLLSPTVAALVMGLSDVVLAGNSVRLFAKNVK